MKNLGKSEVNTKKIKPLFFWIVEKEQRWIFSAQESEMEEEKTGEKGERASEFCIILENMD